MGTELGDEASRRHRPSIREVAPAWIAAIATLLVALTGAGFFAGRASVGPKEALPGPVATVTVLVPAPIPSPTTTPTPGSAPSANGGQPGGTKVGEYDFMIVRGYSVPIGDTAPTQPQFVAAGAAGDLYDRDSSFVAIGIGNRLLGLDANVAPTYEKCKASTLFVDRVVIKQDTAFCLSKDGRMAGIVITAVDHFADGPVTVKVVVWQDSAS